MTFVLLLYVPHLTFFVAKKALQHDCGIFVAYPAYLHHFLQ